MPIYGYRCEQCGHEVEVLQSMSDPPLRSCPECMGPLRKMLYPVGVQFKGSGFYSTDYRSSGSGSNGSGSDSGSSSSSSSGSGSGEGGSKSSSSSEGGGAKSTGGDAKGETKSKGEAKSKE